MGGWNIEVVLQSWEIPTILLGLKSKILKIVTTCHFIFILYA